MLNIETRFTGHYAFLHKGFRPFFLLAGLAGCLLMLLWLAMLGSGSVHAAYPPVYWHAHEMLFGFVMATVSGFLLTAVRNWTSQTTLVGKPLLWLALPWLVSRLLPFCGELSPLYAGLSEWLFLGVLLWVIGRPVIRTRQWAHMGIIGKVALLLPASLAFHLGLAGVWPAGIELGLYAAFYLLLALVITLARRVMPMFIERGLNNGFLPHNSPWADRWGLAAFLLFASTDLALLALPGNFLLSLASALLSGVLCILHAARLRGWYHRGVWSKPLVWVLFVAYGWIVFGFLLKSLLPTGLASFSLATHAFAVGGMGLVTLGMMARISLGHTGRNVNKPPPLLRAIFFLVLLAAGCRVLGPLLLASAYSVWIMLAQISWIAAFLLFVMLYFPILVRARVDGMHG